MKSLLITVAIAVVALGVIAAMLESAKRRSNGEKPRAKRLLTPREQTMHNRLTQSLPDLIVLAQVSFGALLTARARSTRNTFDRKIADFVVCDKAFQVLAVIELDDASHRGKREMDAKRDALLKQVGYRVIRYDNVPDIDRVKSDFAPQPLATPKPLTEIETEQKAAT